MKERYSLGHKLEFDTGTHDWQHSCLIIEPTLPIESVMIFILFVEHAGSVWFDDLTLEAYSRTHKKRGHDELKSSCPRVIVNKTISHGCCPDRRTVTSMAPPRPMDEELDVSIATQLTVDRLDSLLRMVKNWNGPISAAIFTLSPDEDEQVMAFRNANQKIANSVDFHLVSAKKGYTFRAMGLYPVNTLRNVALTRCRTPMALILDVDFMPSPNSYENLRAAIKASRFIRSGGIVPSLRTRMQY